MASIFSKNGILSGRIDYYCLICAEQFTNEDETLAHIGNTQHKEDLRTCGYFEKYKEHFIRKTNGIYFCEPCSLTFPTPTKVELHIEEPSHLTAKDKITPWLKRVENDIVVFDQFSISDDAWNGCVEDTCVLCNTEFDDSSAHKAIRSHALNLIKSEVIFDQVGKTVCRAIDARSQQCLTCNVIFGNEPESHFNSVEHKDAYKLYDLSIRNNETKTTSKDTNTAKETQNVKGNTEKANVKDSGKVDKRNDVGDTSEATSKNAEDTKKAANKNAAEDTKKAAIENVDEVTKKVASINVDEDTTKPTSENAGKGTKKAATKPLEKECKVKNKSKQSPKKENAAELDKIYCKNLAAKNYITSCGIGEIRWCVLCDWMLDVSNERHIHSEHHQRILKLHQEKLAENCNISSADHETIPFDAVDIYQKYNINIDLINETAFCKKCSKNIDFNTNAIDKHIEEHKKAPTKTRETLASGIKSDGTEKNTLYTEPVLINKVKPQNTVSVEDYAKQNRLSHNRADGSYYCHPCSRRLPTTLEALQKHVASKIHSENTQQIALIDSTKAPIVKVPLGKYLKSFEIIGGSVIVINDKFWLNIFSFLLLARVNKKVVCYACHIDLNSDNILHHIMFNDNHKEILEKCLLITSLEGEFIREITLEVYHCGYCNITIHNSDDIVDHIATSEHKSEKSEAEEHLREHQPNYFNRNNSREISEMIRQFGINRGLYRVDFD